MRETLRGVDRDRLERSCGPRANAIRFGPSAPGLERAEVFLSTCAFEPHRHDTYAIGVTLAGVQTFRYRGTRRVCLPGQVHVLHPDETHDGAAGTEDGFGYRILYAAPELVREALGDDELPFVAEPVQSAPAATHVVTSLLADVDEPIDDLARAGIVAFVADVLRSLGTRRERPHGRIDMNAAALVRDYLASHAAEQTPASTLERIAGTDRFTIARHFRRAFGTSPDRYRTLRRLALARTAIENGAPLARAAAEAGFADQSHMTRQFKRAYGLTPAAWAKAVRAGLTLARPPLPG
jgi:AraC-like DNA-binding protein